MTTNRTARMVLMTAASILAASSALAHHSHPLTYNSCKRIEIEGQIESVDWKNPHVHVLVEMDDGSSYTAELPSPDNFARNGTADAAMAALAAGARIIVAGNPLRTPAEMRVRFPDYEIPDRMILDVYSISRKDNSWNWSLTPRECDRLSDYLTNG